MEELFKYINKVTFKNRPNAVPSSYRIICKITQILLIINFCCGTRKGCSLEKLQIISNSINDEKYLDKLKLFMQGKNATIIINYDPSLNRALTYSIAEGLLCIQKNKLFKLSEKGKVYVEKIKENRELCIREKEVLACISTKLTEDMIQKLITDWRLNNVED